LQGVLDATVADGQMPGALLAVSLPGQELWAGASGLADRQQGTPMQPTTPFRIGSLSKMFAAVVALQLVEEGRLQLDAPVATYLPGIVPDAEVMTVRQLMNHTSGLYDYQDNRFISLVARDPGRVWAPEELIGYAVERGAYFAPGARWYYSNTNYVVLGLIIQQATGRTLAEEIRARVIDPLELQHTVFTPDEAAPAELARGYAGASDWSDMHPSHVWGTASIVSTVQDLERFAQALFHEQLLTPESLAEMYGFVNANDSFGMRYLEYGLGLMRNPLAVGPGPDGQERPVELSSALGHIGGVSGYRAALWYLPESDTVIVAGFNEATVDPVLLPTAALDVVLASQGR
jgi:D-alanyl-D-alanine carboxypeptidase